MAIPVIKAADIVDGVIVFVRRGIKPGDAAAILTNEPPAKNAELSWTIEIEIGEGTTKRLVLLSLPPFLPRTVPDTPLFFAGDKLVYFRNRIYWPDRNPRSDAEREEVVLRVKKLHYEEDAELSKIRATVSNLEAAIEYQKSGPKREVIPDDVKTSVWARDGGACVTCGSQENLHFDHIIPVAKGGGNSVANIQILCQACNLKKSDKIASA